VKWWKGSLKQVHQTIYYVIMGLTRDPVF